MLDLPTNSPIVAAYLEKTGGSRDLARKACEIFPSGVTHDSRYMEPHGIYIERARGSRKWDVDGNEYVDFFGGHGSLILGHGNPAVEEAVAKALSNSTHFGAGHPGEVLWGRLVRDLVASAERVRFVSSGTEATMMCLRIARAYTGKRKIIRFAHHFHGWNDHVASARVSSGGGDAAGIVPGIGDDLVILPANDGEALREAFRACADIAGAIIEPTGASFGRVPLDENFVAMLREETQRHGALLIFDEVVTGFRVSPGGAQRTLDITPDLCALAKILAGGFPGGAVAGRRDIMDLLDFEAARTSGRTKIDHFGTFNANPISAAAGVAALGQIARSNVCERASDTAGEIRDAINEVLRETGVAWAAYGTHSSFNLYLNGRGHDVVAGEFDGSGVSPGDLLSVPQPLGAKFHLAMMLHGVTMGGSPGGYVSGVMDDADVDTTVHAVRQSIRMLRTEGDI